MQLYPQGFSDETEGPWDVLGDEYDTNPRELVGAGDHEVVRLWEWAKRGVLPEAVGAGELPCIMLDAFDVLTAAEPAIGRWLRDVRGVGA